MKAPPPRPPPRHCLWHLLHKLFLSLLLSSLFFKAQATSGTENYFISRSVTDILNWKSIWIVRFGERYLTKKSNPGFIRHTLVWNIFILINFIFLYLVYFIFGFIKGNFFLIINKEKKRDLQVFQYFLKHFASSKWWRPVTDQCRL